MELTRIRDVTERLRAEVHKVVVGQDRALDLMLVALLSDGHVLVEGVPGVAKTLLARAFATALGIGFNRIQFTPDLMPGDVIGTNLFNFQTNGFVLTRGPIFADILVADEINRTPPKTQAALLQAMQERAVTIDGTTHPLSPAFMVIATQNPIEQEGTYPLPEAQLDRFLFKVDVGYPTRDEERLMVRVHGHRTATPPIEEFGLQPVAGIADLVDMRRAVAAIRLEEPIVDYVVDLVRATRGKPSLLAGGSPRAANMLATAARARAAVQGRDFVIPDDVKELALPVLRHRVVLAPGAEVDGLNADTVLRRVIEEVRAPR
jgi:MoxR-like ATPase